MTAVPEDPGARFVVSPHATLRWRQGRLTLASGLRPATLVIAPEALPLLQFLAIPRTLAEIEAEPLPVEPEERRPLLRVLLGAEAVEVAPRRGGDAAAPAWWDPRDRAAKEASLFRLIQVAHGVSRSAQAGFCVDHWGRPVPWLARPALDFLAQFDLSGLSVFEYGGGASTWYWTRRCRSVTCVESSARWYETLRAELGTRATLMLRDGASAFASAILETAQRFDVILIDAAPAFRSGCAGPALERLSPRGMVILDDAPFYPDAAAELRAGGLIEVDLTGYSPLEDNLQTTALFLSRHFDLPRRTARSPAFPFGSPFFRWDAFRPDPDG